MIGWGVVDEYLSDELAENSDDEKRIRHAQSRALAKKKKSAKTRTRSKPYQTRRNFDAGISSSASRSSDLFRGYNSQYRQASGFGGGRFGMGFGQSKFTDICFKCGGKGHWRRECQAAKQSIQTKDGGAQGSQCY